MKKHETFLFNATCKEVGIKPAEYVPGKPIEVTRETFDKVVRGILKYFKRHPSAYKAFSGGVEAKSELDLKKIALTATLKFGLYFKEPVKLIK